MTACDDVDSCHLLLFWVLSYLESPWLARVDLQGPIPAFFLSSGPSSSLASFSLSRGAQMQCHRAKIAVHWGRIHRDAQKLTATKAQAFPSVRFQGLPALRRTIILHGESYFLFSIRFSRLTPHPFSAYTNLLPAWSIVVRLNPSPLWE